jgi:hypothetical protein
MKRPPFSTGITTNLVPKLSKTTYALDNWASLFLLKITRIKEHGSHPCKQITFSLCPDNLLRKCKQSRYNSPCLGVKPVPNDGKKQKCYPNSKIFQRR